MPSLHSLKSWILATLVCALGAGMAPAAELFRLDRIAIAGYSESGP